MRNRVAIALTALISVVIGASTLLGANKQRNWENGKVLDSQRSRYFAGMIGNSTTNANAQVYGNAGTYNANTNASQTAVYRTFETFLIEGDKYAYLAQERLRWRGSKPANVTINGPVRFAVEKRKLFLLDDDGKEHAMEIIKKTLRLPVQ